MFVVCEPGPVIGGKDNEGVLSQAFTLQGLEYLPDTPVYLFDDVAVQASQAFALLDLHADSAIQVALTYTA